MMISMKPYFALVLSAIIISMVAGHDQINSTLPKRPKSETPNEIDLDSLKPKIVGPTHEGKVPQDKNAGHVRGNHSAVAKGKPAGPSKQFLGMILNKLASCPWTACLCSSFDPSILCGGALINPSWIATSAYCASYYRRNLTGIIGIPTIPIQPVPLPVPAVPVPVPVGTAPLPVPGRVAMDINPQDVFIYPGYNPATMANDIALIKLPYPVPMGASAPVRQLISLPKPAADVPINTVMLPTRQQATQTFVGRFGVYSAFGPSSLNTSVNVQGTVSGQIMSNLDCARYFGGDFITGATMCLANNVPFFKQLITEPQTGSPLVIQNPDGSYTLQGIASFGPAVLNTPQVFTRVSTYLNWISQTTGIKTP